MVFEKRKVYLLVVRLMKIGWLYFFRFNRIEKNYQSAKNR